MSQRLMAILSLVLMSFIAFRQMQAEQFTRVRMLDDEVETMAAGVSLSVIEYIGTKDFDQNTRLTGGLVTNANTLTSASSFPSGRRCDLTAPIQTTSPYDACDDLEDFNAMQWEQVPFVVRGDTIWFQASAEVTYMDLNQQPTTTRTFSKRVTVLVRDVPVTGTEPLLRLPVRLPRVFSYPK